MNITLSTLVLEDDGTEIDDEVLQEFGNSHIFMALADEQQWTHKIINRKSPVCVEIEADVTPDKNSVDDTESDKSTQPDFIHVVSKTTLPSGLPHPDKIQLPTLSPALHIALSSGEKNSSIFNQVLKECEIFYSATYPGMADSSYYQMIGKKMVSKYSCLGFADGTNPWETETEKSIALVKGLENNVNRKKGKGIKSKSCIKVVKNVQKIDSLPIKHLETEEEEAPYVVVFLDQEGNTLCSHVIGDGRKIIGQTLNVLDSLLLLIAVYYVFDLDYPEIYSQTLGILQQWAIGDQYTQQKSSNWIKFSDVLSRNKNE